MPLVKPESGRAKIEDLGSQLKVIIPTPRNIATVFAALFLLFWLGGWFTGEIFAVKQLIKGAPSKGIDAFLLFWLCGWTLGGAFVLATALWLIAGREIITISAETIKIEIKVFNIGLSKEYAMSEAKNFRLNSSGSSSFSQVGTMPFMTGGAIAFDYGMRTIRFARGIDEAEASSLVDKFKERGFIKEDNKEFS
ncbi:MAG: hypothetical protein M1536_04515 [Firmicutes bacterium]|nr:hypothetical protein [Bacillota bacterium]